MIRVTVISFTTHQMFHEISTEALVSPGKKSVSSTLLSCSTGSSDPVCMCVYITCYIIVYHCLYLLYIQSTGWKKRYYKFSSVLLLFNAIESEFTACYIIALCEILTQQFQNLHENRKTVWSSFHKLPATSVATSILNCCFLKLDKISFLSYCDISPCSKPSE